jgi:threonine dehydrogenase-like Zn-dependent dehydrogenase
MEGVVFLGDRELELRSFPDPKPDAGEVVLEMKASGMCGSDLHAYRADRAGGGVAAALGLGADPGPVVAGHEPCGVIVDRGRGVDPAQAPIGDRVMVHHYKGCGACPHCRQGWAQLCGEGFVVYGITGDGAHARYMKAPVSTLVPLPDALNFEEGAAISCGTGTAYGALRRMALTGGTTLAVFGQGPVGLSATLLATAMGSRVIAVDLSAERLALAGELGATELVNADDVDTVEALKELTGGRGVDLALDCSGAATARVAAVRSTRTWGTVCFVGEGGEVTFNVSPDMIRRQLTLLGSWTFSSIGQGECARFVADLGIPLHRLVTHRYSLDQAQEAYRLFDTQTTGKGVFVF